VTPRLFGRYDTDPTPAQLDRFFHLDAADRELVEARRGDHNRLGFALQLGTVRFLGTFLPDPTDVPGAAVAYVAAQLGVDPGLLKGYVARQSTQWEHTRLISQAYGYRDFTDPQVQAELTGWLHARTRTTTDRTSVLVDLAAARLLEAKVLLPGPSLLERLVAGVRDDAAQRLYAELAALPDPAAQARLRSLLEVDPASRTSRLERLRRGPASVTAAGLLGALDRLEQVRALGVTQLDLTAIPAGRVDQLARYATAARAQAVGRLAEPRRTATLLAAARTLHADATDDLLDLLDRLLAALLARSQHAEQRDRLRALPALDVAARSLREAVAVLLDPPDAGRGGLPAVWAALAEHGLTRDQLSIAVEAVGELSRQPESWAEQLLSRYSHVRRFLPQLLDGLQLEATAGGQSVLAALDALRALEGRRKVSADEVPLELATGAWQRLVVTGDGTLDRRAYTFCVLERLRDALRRRDVYAPGSSRWADPRARLLTGSAWDGVRDQVCASLGHQADPTAELDALTAELDTAYRAVAQRLPDNAAVRVETDSGRDRPVLTPLDRLPEPDSLTALREQLAGRLPRIDLPDLLLEVAGWTGLTAEFTHVSEGASRAPDLHLSVCAVLIAEACNIGLEPLVHPGQASLTRARLSWVEQNYLRADTLTAANSRLVDAQTDIALAAAWGGGDVASADGLRFVVPVRTLNAGPNPRYFGPGRGVTYLNFLSDQFTGFHAVVVPGTLRDSLYILEGLLEQQTSLRPVELMSDTAGYSDIIFGLFRLLGYQFSPRLADLSDTRFWRTDSTADYGPLNGIARHRADPSLIATHWEDLLRVAGSLSTGAVRASEILRVLQGGGRPTPTGRAIAELGRIAKTLYLLAYLDDEPYRRRILTQLNRTESRHALARQVFHGQRGQLRQRYREGQEDQLGALGLVLNAIVLWNTRYLDAALTQLRAEGRAVNQDDVARLSPLIHEHINLLGRYHFTDPTSTNDRLRPLRDPTTADD
jgi:TnpA family transposase